MERKRIIGIGLGVLACLGCLVSGCGSAALEAQGNDLAREHRERMERLERLEARLLGAVAKRAEWSELRSRHGRVTELACENAADHVEAMARHDQRERDKRRKVRARRVAAATASPEPSHPPSATARDLGDAPSGLGEGGPAD